jgi:hypothetical protein
MNTSKSAYDWLSKCIASCQNEDHLFFIPIMIELFNTKWGQSNPQATDSLRRVYAEKQLGINPPECGHFESDGIWEGKLDDPSSLRRVQ